MTPEIRDRLLDTFDELAQMVGGHSFAQGVNELSRFFERLLEIMNQMRTREQLAAAFDKEEIAPEEAQLALAALQIVPQLLGMGVKQLGEAMSKDFPIVSPGRKQLLSPERQSEVCTFIGGLFAKGVPLKVCKERAAKRFGVGVRTIERVWQSRAKLPETDNKPDFESAKKWLFAVLGGLAEPNQH